MKINLLQTSFIISLIGIFILLTISNVIEPKQISIKNINNQLLNKNTKISGQIINLKNFPESNFQLINLQDKTGEITITLDKITTLSKNQSITVIGEITEYKGELQINAHKILES